MKIEELIDKCVTAQTELLDSKGYKMDKVDSSCEHCRRSIYLDFERLMEDTGRFGVSKGYTLNDAKTKLLVKCPHCDREYRTLVKK